MRTENFASAGRVSANPGLKIIWATLAYVAWDMSYTFCDVPMFVLPTSMTDNIKERGQLLTMGRYFAMIGIMATSMLLRMLQARFGWFFTSLIFIIIGALTMLPLCFKGKERHIVRPEKEITIRQMIKYVVGNKFLLIFYLAMFISGVTNFAQYIGIYFARYNLGNQDMASLIAMLSMIPTLIIGAFLPAITKRLDKFNLYIICNIAAAALKAAYNNKGRIVIPMELRRTLHIRENDPIEIFMGDSGEMVLKKFSHIINLGSFYINEYVKTLQQMFGNIDVHRLRAFDMGNDIFAVNELGCKLPAVEIVKQY